MEMNTEHLTPEEILSALKHCIGDLGEDGCDGCPNAIPGTKDKHGLCMCRFNMNREMIRFVESVVGGKKGA